MDDDKVRALRRSIGVRNQRIAFLNGALKLVLAKLSVAETKIRILEKELNHGNQKQSG